jgi:hypothetical protein
MDARGQVICVDGKLIVVADLLQCRQRHKQVMRVQAKRPHEVVVPWQQLGLSYQEFMRAVREYERRFAGWHRAI